LQVHIYRRAGPVPRPLVPVARGATSVADAAIGDGARQPGFVESLYFALATISGLALFQITIGTSLDALWEQARQHLADGLSGLSR
jgi:hypothetical protein